ncbi:apolipoprotein L1 isoform X2 [Brachyistius frenatus]|uniref:apolipoprotein L1 isoform X2 n=1 Tax=Brachyistius frenatus TaxID=100188 RepID=UPI0037E78D96
MDRYDHLDLDLDCDGGGGSVAQKASLFGGMLKRSSKSAEPSVQTQDSLSVSSELSKSEDSLTDNNNTKDKGGVFKGMFKKTTKSDKEGQTQATMTSQNPELSASSDSLTDNKSSKNKSGVFGGILKRSPRPGHARRPSQDLLELSDSNDSLSENANTKESGGMFSGMFKKSSKPFGARTQSQEDLSAGSELSGSTDNLSVTSNTKESGGIFSGMFKKSPKPFGARTQSQDDLSAGSELSDSTDSLSVTSNTKESGGIFSGMFKKSPKPFGARTQSQDDLSAGSELSDSTDNLSVNSNTKESGGMFSGMFKKSPKPFGAKTQSQDDLSAPSELSGSNDNLSENHTKEKGGIFGVFRKKGAKFQSQDDLSLDGELSSSENLMEKPSKGGIAAKILKNPFASSSQHEKQTDSDDEGQVESSGKSAGNKQNAVVQAMSKLNPFRSANKKDTEDKETLKENEKHVEEKPKPVKSNKIQRERKDRSETPPVLTRRAEEMRGTSAHDKVKPRRTEDNKSQLGDEDVKEDESAATKDGDEMNPAESRATKVKKPKHANPFVTRAAVKAPSDDEGLKEDDESLSTEEKKEEDGKEKTEETKVKKPKRHNPFMPRVKTKATQRNVQDEAEGNTAENEGGNRSLFDRLEDFRIDPAQPQGSQDVEDLMDWWNTVEPWEDTPQDEDMTEKEEANAFAVTAEKVQKGIRVFNKLFSERAEALWQHVINLNAIADSLDKFNKKTKIAQITGGSTSAIGGVATIAGLALAPVTFGTSLIVTAVGLGVATAGGLTSAGAGISNQVNNSMDRKKVEKIVEDYQEKMLDLNKCLKFIKQGIENLRRFDLLRLKKNAYNQDFPELNSRFYEDGAMAGKAILINANEIMRVVQIANVAGSTAARAVQIASMATGVLTGLFVGMDIYFVAKDSKELKKGAKSEFAAKIRDVATQLHDGLVELNGIRDELQSTAPENDAGDPTEASDSYKKEKEDKDDSSEEDEIDRIKKAIKKDYENREYV